MTSCDLNTSELVSFTIYKNKDSLLICLNVEPVP